MGLASIVAMYVIGGDRAPTRRDYDDQQEVDFYKDF